MEKLTKRNVIEMMMKESAIASNEIYMNFLTHELELLDRKKSSGSKVNETNETIKDLVYNALLDVNKAVTISELMTLSEDIKNFTYEDNKETKTLSNQKINYVLGQLVKEDKVTNIKDKKSSLYMVK